MCRLRERFWAKVDRRDNNGCWLWTGSINPKGYGRLRNATGTTMAHRISWELENGPIPNGLQVDHMCLTRRCVNPTHLRLVTSKQNQEHRAGAQRNNLASGARGVYRNGNRWTASVKHHGVIHYMGTYDTIEEAKEAAAWLRQELFTHDDGKVL